MFVQKCHGVNCDCYAALHVEHARTPSAPIAYAKWHLLQRSQAPNRVGMAEQEDRFALGDTVKVRLHMIAETFGHMNLRVCAVVFEPGSKKFRQVIHGRLVTAGRFDLDQSFEIGEKFFFVGPGVGDGNHCVEITIRCLFANCEHKNYNFALSLMSADESTSVTTAEPEQPANENKALDITAIQAILPHRYPFLLIDRVIEIERKKRIVAIKNVTVNEPFFAGHFPGYPIMPGVLMVEAIAQAGGALLLTEIPDRDQKLMVFTGIERAKFRKPVTPGDQLRVEVDVLAWRATAVKMQGNVFVGDKLACEAVVTCQLVSRPA